jgi:hypothetical protein
MSFAVIAPYLLCLALTAGIAYLWNMQRLAFRRIAELAAIVQRLERKNQ